METTAKVGSVKGMAEAFLVGRAPNPQWAR
jgi:hypothetical protein